MKKIILFLLGFYLFFLYAYASENCEAQKIYFFEGKREENVFLSNIFCEYGKTQIIQNPTGSIPKKKTLVSYDRIKNHILQPKKSEIVFFIQTLQEGFKNIKTNYSLREGYLIAFIQHPQKFQNIAFQMFEQFVLHNHEKRILQHVKSLDINTQLFETTYGERLLMGGKIISRAEWGADENIGKPEVFRAACQNGNCSSGPSIANELRQNYLENFNLIDATLRKEITYNDGRLSHKYYPVDRIIIHHTASEYVDNKDDAKEYMKSLQKYHGITLRWSDIGYHYLIDGQGNIYEGRAGGKYVLGAHVTSHNFGSIGISLMSDGYYSDEMLASLRQLIGYLGEEYGLDISKQQKVRNKDLTGVEFGEVVIAHKELDSGKPIDPDIDMSLFRQSLRNYVFSQRYLRE